MVSDALKILYVDDNDGDIELTALAAAESRIECKLHTMGDGMDVLSYLRKEGQYIACSDPDVIIMDWNMPKMGGLEVLEHIRSNEAFLHIPVIIFTSSEAPGHINAAYEAGANCYITKPVDLDQYIKSIVSILHFWSLTGRITQKNTQSEVDYINK